MRATGLILVGGLSTRMNGIPKHQLPLGDGRPILRHLIDALERADIAPVVLGSGQGVYEETGLPHDVLFFSDAQPNGGTARAVAGVASLLNHRRTEPLLVCYGDTFLPGFDYASACYPETLTIASISNLHGNVAISGRGADYHALRADGSGETPLPWIEVGATCIRFDQLGDVGKFRGFPHWLETRTFPRICIHDGLVLTTGTPTEYDVARSWTP